LRERLETTLSEIERPPIAGTGRLDIVAGLDFDAVVRNNGKRLFNLAFHMLGNSQEAEEVVQDIFLEAYASLPGFKGDAPLANWLYKIAVNVLADHISAKKRKPRVADELSLEDRVQIGTLPVGADSAETEYMKAANLNKIRRAVLKLPTRHRAVFVLNVVEGYSHKEIAKILGISPGAARVIRVRAARTIREEMMKHGMDGGGGEDAM
jgi:RNA polymerase sigma-70 factor, ECF subfamily